MSTSAIFVSAARAAGAAAAAEGRGGGGGGGGGEERGGGGGEQRGCGNERTHNAREAQNLTLASDPVGPVARELRRDPELPVEGARLGRGLDALTRGEGDVGVDRQGDLLQPRELLRVGGRDVVVEAHRG